MYRFSTYKEQYRANLKLALPVVLTQLGQILTQFADNLMVGRYGGDDPTPLAAVSFGGSVFFILFIAAIGVALGLTPLVGELYAQGDRRRSAALLQNGVLFFTLLGIVIGALQYAAIPLLYHMKQPVDVVDMAIPYYRMLVVSMPFIMLFFAFKQFLEGVGNTKVEMVVTIIANLANIGFNWVFIYGNLGFAEMGAEGAGLGTLLSRILAPILMIAYFYRQHRYRIYLTGFSPRNYSWRAVRDLLRMGLPISLQMFLESSAFVGTGIMMGWLGKVAMSANQIAITLGNCAFMIVMSIGAATTIRVSRPGLERLCCAGLHLAAALHPDALHVERRGDRHHLAAARLRGALPALRRVAERLDRHPARHSGRQGHHADRLHLLLAAEPARGVSVRLHARHGSLGALPRLLVRSFDGGAAADSAHPAQRAAIVRRELKIFSYLYANYTPMDNERQYDHTRCKPEIGRGCAFCECGDEVEARPCGGCFKLHETPWLEGYPVNEPTDIVEVRFKNTRRSFYQNVNNLPLKVGDIVAVEASPGHDIGIVSMTGDLVARQMRRTGFNPYNGEYRKVYRKAKPYDIERWQEAIALEHETMIASRQIAADMGLNMKIGDVEYQGDKIKAIFYYIADERVDFRELIKVFAERFHIRIEMKQIGARQEAGRIGGLGACGRELCCASWMSSFSSVTTGAARVQDISLNPQKLAGQCSKLKCCMMYEYDAYVDARKEFPRLREPLQTADGEWFLVKSDILAGTMTFSSSKETMSNLTTLSVGRVKEIMALNRQGVRVEQLQHADDIRPTAEEPTYRSEEDSITRFDQAKRRKRGGRNRNRGERAPQQGTAEAQAAQQNSGAPDEAGKQNARRRQGDNGSREGQPRGARPDQRPRRGEQPEGANAAVENSRNEERNNNRGRNRNATPRNGADRNGDNGGDGHDNPSREGGNRNRHGRNNRNRHNNGGNGAPGVQAEGSPRGEDNRENSRGENSRGETNRSEPRGEGNRNENRGENNRNEHRGENNRSEGGNPGAAQGEN